VQAEGQGKHTKEEDLKKKGHAAVPVGEVAPDKEQRTVRVERWARLCVCRWGAGRRPPIFRGKKEKKSSRFHSTRYNRDLGASPKRKSGNESTLKKNNQSRKNDEAEGRAKCQRNGSKKSENVPTCSNKVHQPIQDQRQEKPPLRDRHEPGETANPNPLPS